MSKGNLLTPFLTNDNMFGMLYCRELWEINLFVVLHRNACYFPLVKLSNYFEYNISDIRKSENPIF